MKETAVEWLKVTVKAMIENGEDADLYAVLWHIEQAREMEMEQMLKFGIKCQMDFIKSDGIRSVEDIWEETFNTNEK